MNFDYIPDFQKGEVILIDKPLKLTSFRVIEKIRKIINFRKIGHAGTLDPLATGLLIVCTGNKTKEIEKYQSMNKVYCGEITLGMYSQSFDLETELNYCPIPENLNINRITKIVKEFIGEINQLPPMYSAIKQNGQRLYQAARAGRILERKTRKVIIYDFKINNIDLPKISFNIVCSKGTYIRSLIDDFGKALGTRAVLTALRRESIGQFNVSDAFNLSELSDLFSENKLLKIFN